MSRDVASPTDVDATLTSTLDTLDDAVNYLAWIVSLIAPSLRAPILEVGAGHGTFTESFAQHGSVRSVEPGRHASSVLATRFADDERVSVTSGFVSDVPVEEVFGTAVMINVLEHIEDDLGSLVELHERLESGGHLAIWVPAFEFLYSDFDRKLGHHRRYRRNGLRSIVRDAGFDVLDCSYVNLPGWFSWLIVTRLLRQEPTAGPLVKIFDRFVVPVVRRIESRFTPPFGQSILLIARKA